VLAAGAAIGAGGAVSAFDGSAFDGSAGASCRGSVLVVIASVAGDAGVIASEVAAGALGVTAGATAGVIAVTVSAVFLPLEDSGWATVDFGKPLSLVAASG
jgi:hypothetical protein